MMLCNADFDEIFASAQQRADHMRPAASFPSPGAACLARWEDDGGRTLPHLSRGKAHAARRDRGQISASHPMRVGMALATMPAAAAYGAAWTMLSTYDRMTRS